MRPLIPPPVIGLSAAGAMWLVHQSVPGPVLTFSGQSTTALGVAALGFAIDLASVVHFWRRKTTVNPFAPAAATSLVTGGLYRISRNPMYFGMLLILTGWGIHLGNPVNLAVLAVFVLVVTFVQIKLEERALEKQFGETFRAYRARVRRWI